MVYFPFTFKELQIFSWTKHKILLFINAKFKNTLPSHGGRTKNWFGNMIVNKKPNQ